MTHLYLIRHGEAISAVEHLFGDTDLTPLGIKQAERLRDRLAATGEITADVLISSTLRRAHQTAKIVAPALGLPLILDDEVQELHEGEAAGLHEEEYLQKYGRVDFSKTPFRPLAPGGENWGQFMLRVSTALERIITEHAGKKIVIFCHGGVIDGSLLYFFNMPTMLPPKARFHTNNTSITHWRYEQERNWRSPGWRLMKYNDDMHIRDIGLPQPIPWEEIFSQPEQGITKPTIPIQSE